MLIKAKKIFGAMQEPEVVESETDQTVTGRLAKTMRMISTGWKRASKDKILLNFAATVFVLCYLLDVNETYNSSSTSN